MLRVSSAATPLIRRTEPAARAPKLTVVRPDAFVGAAAATAVRADSPYLEQITAAYQQNLGRAPTAEEIAKADAFARTLPAQNVDAALRWVICAGPEWQARAVCREELHREPTADELQKSIAFGNDLMAQGKSTGEMRDTFIF